MFFVKYEELCKKANKTTTGVALELGVPKSTVAYWRANHNVIPKQEILVSIADYFGVSVDYLLGNEPNEPDSDDTLRFALFGADSQDITKEMLDEIREIAAIKREMNKRKNGT